MRQRHTSFSPPPVLRILAADRGHTHERPARQTMPGGFFVPGDLLEELAELFPGINAGIGTLLALYQAETNIFFSFLKVLWLILAERGLPALRIAARRRNRRRDSFCTRWRHPTPLSRTTRRGRSPSRPAHSLRGRSPSRPCAGQRPHTTNAGLVRDGDRTLRTRAR